MVIGIMGAPATGKSTVDNILKSSFDAKVILLENVEKSLLRNDSPVYDKLLEVFGEEILLDISKSPVYGASAQNKIRPMIDKKRLMAAADSQPDGRKKLDDIIQPEVGEALKEAIASYPAKKKDNLLVVTLKGTEGNTILDQCDEIWEVKASEEVRIERLKLVRGLSGGECLKVLNSKSAEAVQTIKADFVIDNSGDIENTVKQIKDRLK